MKWMSEIIGFPSPERMKELEEKQKQIYSILHGLKAKEVSLLLKLIEGYTKSEATFLVE